MKNLIITVAAIAFSSLAIGQTTSTGSAPVSTTGTPGSTGMPGTAGTIPTTTNNPTAGTTGSGTINDTMNTTNMQGTMPIRKRGMQPSMKRTATQSVKPSTGIMPITSPPSTTTTTK